MSILYRTVTRSLYFLALPALKRKARGGDPVWRGRLLMDIPVGPVDIWIHAASAGETKMASILIDHLLAYRPELAIHVTVMTEAGYEAAKNYCPDAVSVSYFPLDISPLMKKMFTTLQPRILAIAETEIWPNLVTRAHSSGIPIVLINGRMSEKAFGRYKRLRRWFTRLLGYYTYFFLKSEEDLERFARFGVADDRAAVVGDMKFDAPMAPRSEGRRREMRYRGGVEDNQVLLVAGSTRPGEERMLLALYQRLHLEYPRFRLLMAPRHLDRMDEIRALCEAESVPYVIYGEHNEDKDAVILVDRMGILNDLYASAEIAFVGGTLVELGGHNVLEPVWAGTPVLFGPSVDNVAEAAAHITEHGYGAQVDGPEALGEHLIQFLSGAQTFKIRDEKATEHSATEQASRYLLALLDREDASHA